MSQKTKESFEFYTRMILPELTGIKVSSLSEMISALKEVAPSSIYHHTHRFIQQYQYLSSEPPNDFAYWITVMLGDYKLGEKLSSINTIEFSTLSSLREAILTVMEDHARENPMTTERRAYPGEEFHFVKSISFIFPTGHIADDMDEFAGLLEKVTINSIYFHMFEARLRLEKGDNDFSLWIRTAQGESVIADRISRLDPYAYSLEDLRVKIIRMIRERK